MSEKYRTVQSLNLHFLQNSPLFQLHNFTSNIKYLGNIPGSQLVITFSAS